MSFKNVWFTASVIILMGCVPQRKYAELESRYNQLAADHQQLDTSYNGLKARFDVKSHDLEVLNDSHTRLKAEFEEMQAQYERVKQTYEQLTQTYERRIASESMTKDELKKSLRELEDKLQKKELELNEKEAYLIKREEEIKKLSAEITAIDKNLKDREAHVKELENLIKQKDENVIRLKETLTKALLGYKESGLTVTSKDGKVYVSVDETLLFQSGKTEVSPDGKKALLKLCETLKNNTDFDIMIEGHTDDVPIKTARFDDNWDLSVLRATSITRIMTIEGGISPLKIIPSGRGEFFPVDKANTKEARAKNRRIEIILSPSLKEIMNILSK